jgi:ABC-type multidrug transport system ATPase subunit
MIELKDISFTREGFHLKIDKLKLQAGITLLVGRNGSGKSTLLSLLATAISSGQGEIRYGGATTETSLPMIRSQIGYMPSGVELHEEMTTEQLLQYLAQLKGIHAKQAQNSLINEFGLDDLRKSKLKKLSQGEKQRVAIAQAFLGAPAFLLLDEPLTYLDSLERKRVISTLMRYSTKHLVVVATHELNEWDPHVERILWLDQGQIRFFDTPQQWLRDLPKQVWVAAVSIEEVELLHHEAVIGIKAYETTAEIRLIAKESPDQRFTAVTPTIEDAYFIRATL